MTHASTVLILGARGRFGRAAAQAFAVAGWHVLAQRRSPDVAAGSPGHPAIRWIDVNMQDTAALTVQAQRASVVVHAMNPPYTAAAWRAEAPAQMRSAIAIGRALGALLMFPGNVYNFGAGMPAVLREDTPQRPSDGKGQVRVALERQLMDAANADAADLQDAATQAPGLQDAAAQASGLRSVVIRAGDFFGSGTGSLFDRVLVPKLVKGRMGFPASLQTRTAWAYLPDLARTFVQVARQAPALQGAATLHFRGHDLTGQDWLDALTQIAREQGWLAPGASLAFDAMPWTLIRAVGLLVPTCASLAETRYVWNTPHTLDNARLQALIGDEPHTPLLQAARQGLTDLGLIAAAPAVMRTA